MRTYWARPVKDSSRERTSTPLQVLSNVQVAENEGTTASDALRRFIDPEWDATCRRLLATYLNGLRASRAARHLREKR